MPTIHCPQCGELLVGVPVILTAIGGEPVRQHVTCPACGSALVRESATRFGIDALPWCVDDQPR